jgi:hypothetical protein
MDYSYWCIGFFEKIFINIFLINSENSLKGFWQQFGLRQQFGILATIWDFGNSLGFWQQFVILATVWDFSNDLGFWQRFGIWDLGFGIWDFGIYRFWHPSLL